MSLLEYQALLTAGKKVTRRNVQNLHTPTLPARLTPKKQRPKPIKPPKKRRKLDDQDIIAPSPTVEEFKLRFMEGWVYGDVTRHRRLWVKGDTWMVGRILSFEPVQGNYYPKLYEIGVTEDDEFRRETVDISISECYLGGSLVEHNGEPAEVLWNFGREQTYPQITICYLNNNATELVDVNELSSFEGFNPIANKYNDWVNGHKNRNLDLDDLEKFLFRFVRVQKSVNKVVRGLFLRYHSGKIFVFTRNKLVWLKFDYDKVTWDCTEPPVPMFLLERFSFTRTIRTTFKSFWQKRALEYKQDEKLQVEAQRCKKCLYIIDDLEWRHCAGCENYFHAQCLSDVERLPDARGDWRCTDCLRCSNCCSTLGTIIRCLGCNQTFHQYCMDPLVQPVPNNGVWKWENCAKCAGCGLTPVDGLMKWNEDFTRCKQCEIKWRKHEYCAVCNKLWFTKKDSKDMIGCDKWELWIHVGCDPLLTPEKFHALSINENSKYFCPNCRRVEESVKMAKLVKEIKKLEPNGYFLNPVDEPNYTKVIKKPMWFRKIIQRAKQGKYTDNIQKLIQDVNLLCDNAMCFLKANTNGYQAAAALKVDAKALIKKRFKTTTADQTIPELESPKKIPIEAAPTSDAIVININKSDIAPYINSRQRPSFYPAPIAIFYNSPALNEVELCYICSSFIRSDSLWMCITCGRAFHEFCIQSNQLGDKDAWHCLDCRVCLLCNNEENALNMMSCKVCSNSYHVKCLWPDVTEVKLDSWICDSWFSCTRCGSASYHAPGFSPKNENFYNETLLCYSCSWVKNNNKFCPICDKDWTNPYEDVEAVTTPRHYCKYCGMYFHEECAPDWRGACSQCYSKNINYSQVESANVNKIHQLLGLISQINFYKEICTQWIEKQFGLQPEFAKELANLFLVDNAEFMSTSPEIINLFASRGVDIVKTECTRKPNYRLSTVPMIQGLRRSDLPLVRVPQIKSYKPEAFYLWNIDWDTSSLILNVQSDVGPLKEFEIIENISVFQVQKIHGVCENHAHVHDFDLFCHHVAYPELESMIIMEPTQLASSPTKSSAPEVPGTRSLDTNFEVLRTEFTNETLVDQYIAQEVPAAIAITNRFAMWLKDNFMNLVLHELNRNQVPASDPLYTPKITPTVIHEAVADVNMEDVLSVDDDTLINNLEVLECCLCRQNGERIVTGRLIPAEDVYWVHINCALWSTDVQVLEIGGIVNFGLIFQKAKKQKCRVCGNGGASLQCRTKRCASMYHFPCALEAGVIFEEKRTIICPDCINEPPKPIYPRETMVRDNYKQLVVTKGKKFQKKPVFSRNMFNRVGSLILCQIPEQGVHENFQSYRRWWVDDQRTLMQCEKRGKVFRISANGETIKESENIEKLKDAFKRDFSFVLRTTSDFFGYGVISHFLPPPVETPHYTPIKQQYRSLEDELKLLEASQFGASILAPFIPVEHKPYIIARKTGATNYDESTNVTKKSENALFFEYKKFKKNPMNDSLEILSSSIHGFGLFTTVDVPQGSIVAEYIGEVIRNKVADLREEEYENSGIGSCYMFRLNDDYVIDATRKGGKARFINHSWTPNCEAAVCSFQESSNHILLFAKRPIVKGEEITYDYKFEVERDKIACSCGSRECAGKLN